MKVDDQLAIQRDPTGRPIVKLSDFGLTRFLGGDGEGLFKFIGVGTPHYQAPEVKPNSRYGVKVH